MMLKVLIFLIIASAAFAESAFCTNWKYCGHQYLDGVDHCRYYDFASMTKSRHVVKFWIQYVATSEVNNTTDDQFQPIYMGAKSKLEKGYIPPYALHRQMADIEEIESIIRQEQRVEALPYNAKFRALTEINCIENKQRILEFFQYKGSQVLAHDSEASQWEFIAPGTTADTLQKMLCDTRISKIN